MKTFFAAATIKKTRILNLKILWKTLEECFPVMPDYFNDI